MTSGTHTPPPQPSGVAVLLGAVLSGAAAAYATFSSDDLLLAGRVIVAACASTVGALVVYALYKSSARGLAVLGIVCATVLGGAAVATFRKEAPDGVASFVGGCAPFTVYAQNRWEPFGASGRATPAPTGTKVRSFSSNELVAVDGWVRTRAPYLANKPPFNSDVWFHLADDSGWVAFAAVRADPTVPDPTGGFSDDGGRPAPMAAECSGSVQG